MIADNHHYSPPPFSLQEAGGGRRHSWECSRAPASSVPTVNFCWCIFGILPPPENTVSQGLSLFLFLKKENKGKCQSTDFFKTRQGPQTRPWPWLLGIGRDMYFSVTSWWKVITASPICQSRTLVLAQRVKCFPSWDYLPFNNIRTSALVPAPQAPSPLLL